MYDTPLSTDRRDDDPITDRDLLEASPSGGWITVYRLMGVAV